MLSFATAILRGTKQKENIMKNSKNSENSDDQILQDQILSDLKKLSKYRLEMLLTNGNITDLILQVAVNNMFTIGKDLLEEINEEEINTMAHSLRIANCIASNPKASEIICKSIVNLLIKYIGQGDFDHIINIQSPIHEKLYPYFAIHENEEARSYIASQNCLPYHFLQQLARDTHWLVRLRIAQRKNLGDDLINLLASDEDDYVRSAIRKNYELTD